MTDIVDPGDPFRPGSLRFEARRKLLGALETLLGEIAEHPDMRPRDHQAFGLVLEAHRVWALYGRDGE